MSEKNVFDLESFRPKPTPEEDNAEFFRMAHNVLSWAAVHYSGQNCPLQAEEAREFALRMKKIADRLEEGGTHA